MTKEEAKKQFDYLTEKNGIIHTFPFDTVWSFLEYVDVKSKLEYPTSYIPAEYTQEEFRKGIQRIEKKMETSPLSYTRDEAEYFNPLKQSLVNGLYIREIFNPAGELIVTKIHKVKHIFFLLKGKMTIMQEDGQSIIEAPHYGVTKAGTKRVIYTHEDSIFVTVHPTNKKTVEEAEKEIVAKDFNDLGE